MLSRYEEPSIPVPLGFMGIEQININGEQFIYWTTCLLMLVMMIHIMFNVREKKPMEIPHFQHFDPLRYFKNVLGIIVESSARQPRKGEVRIRPHIFMQKQWLLLFSLIACQVCILQSIGPLEPLLITKQFGYSTRVLGNINFIWNLSMILVIPVAGFFADKVDRAKMFRLGIFISTFMPISYYMYVKVLAPDQIPAGAGYNSVQDRQQVCRCRRVNRTDAAYLGLYPPRQNGADILRHHGCSWHYKNDRRKPRGKLGKILFEIFPS